MKEVTEWWDETHGSRSDWAVLGKGPTFARRAEFDLRPYRTLTLNHAIREMKADVAHVADIDVIGHCGEDISRNAAFLLMPRFPYAGSWVRTRPLDTFLAEYPVLERLNGEGRVVCYDLGASTVPTGPREVPAAPFSGAMAVYLLGMLGARRVRTLGVDGGRAYAPAFADLVSMTLLSNGLSDFDIQFEQIAASVRKFGVDFAPLVGDTPAWRAAMYVYFLRRRAKDALKPVRDALRRERAAEAASPSPMRPECPGH